MCSYFSLEASWSCHADLSVFPDFFYSYHTVQVYADFLCLICAHIIMQHIFFEKFGGFVVCKNWQDLCFTGLWWQLHFIDIAGYWVCYCFHFFWLLSYICLNSFGWQEGCPSFKPYHFYPKIMLWFFTQRLCCGTMGWRKLEGNWLTQVHLKIGREDGDIDVADGCVMYLCSVYVVSQPSGLVWLTSQVSRVLNTYLWAEMSVLMAAQTY